MSRSRAFAARPELPVPLLAAALLGAAFAAVAFGAAGGTELSRTTIVEIAVTLTGAAIVAAAVVWGPRERLHGGLTVLLLGAVAFLTALSITWSVAPELSFVEAGRTLSYLAVLAAAVGAARLAPRGSPVLLYGILLGTLAVALYALASRVWPGALAEDELSARIGQPYGYWNAVGTTAAMAIPPALWLGSRRGGGMALRSLAYPAVGLATLAILLTQSRGAIAAALIGAALWFAVVPLRLRSMPVLLIPVAGVAPVAAWALSKDAFSESLQPLAVKQSVAGELGLLIAVLVAGLLLAGVAVELVASRSAPPVRLQRKLGVAAVVAAAAVPLLLFTSVAFSDRGIGGTISDRLDELTSETASTPGDAGRLTAASSSRGRYWRQAGRVFADRRVAGTGAGTFPISRLRYRKDELVSRHAHGFVPQTLADLGLVGLLAVLALLAAWLAAAGRATGLYPLRLVAFGQPNDRAELPRRDWHPERVAVVALALVAIVFGLQSAIDWTWFVPGPAVIALAAAGFVAGRGPLPELGARPAPPPASTRRGGRLRLAGLELPAPERPRLIAGGAVLLAALLVAWATWQPERSDRASTRALELLEDGRSDRALAEAREARDANPLSPRPLLVEATALTSVGRRAQAEQVLERAVLEFPDDPQTWVRLADFELHTLDRPSTSLSILRGALYLDPYSKSARSLFLEARIRERQKRAAAPAG